MKKDKKIHKELLDDMDAKIKYIKDIKESKNMNKLYSTSLNNLIANIACMIENEPNENMRKKHREYRDLLLYRQSAIHDKFTCQV